MIAISLIKTKIQYLLNLYTIKLVIKLCQKNQKPLTMVVNFQCKLQRFQYKKNQFKINKLGILDVKLEITLRQCIAADEIGSSN